MGALADDDPNSWIDDPLSYGDRLLNELMNAQVTFRGGALSGKREELFGQLCPALGAVEDEPREASQTLVFDLAIEDLGGSHDASQHVVEVVGDAARELAEGIEAPNLRNVLL